MINLKKINFKSRVNDIKTIFNRTTPKNLQRKNFSIKAAARTPVKLSYTTYTSPGTSSPTASPPVIIMHGLFGSKVNWNTLAKAINLQTKRQVLTIDARNHGESPHSSDMTYASMAEDVKQLLKDINIDKSILIGHSMGGAAMMLTSLNYPDIVDKLIIVDMSPVKTSPSLFEMTKIIDTLQSVTFENYKTLSEARKGTDKLLSSTISSLSLRQFLITNVSEVEPGVYKWRVNLPVIAEHFSTNIAVFPQLIPKLNNKSFDGQTLFIAGRNSDYIKPEDESEIKKLFTRAEICYIEGAGHWVQSDKPTEFLRVACDYINR